MLAKITSFSEWNVAECTLRHESILGSGGSCIIFRLYLPEVKIFDLYIPSTAYPIAKRVKVLTSG